MPVLELITSSGFASLVGMRHALSLLVAGLALVLVRREMPASLADTFEIAVAAMLIGLGMRSVLQAAWLGSKGPARIHRHRWIVHQHPGMPAHVHIGKWTFARRPLLIGAIHGLAG